MTTFGDLIEDTRRHIGLSEERDVLNGSITNSASTLVTTDARSGIQEGAFIEIDLEVMYVRSVATNTVTVFRGETGTTAAAHTTGAKITVVDPKFSKFAIGREINNELASLSSPSNGLFRIVTLDLSWASTTYGYDLVGVGDIEDVLSVQWKGYVGYEWIEVPATQWRLARNQKTTDFTSGYALFFDEPVSGRDVRVVYKGAFSPLVNLTDDLTTVSGLPESARDIPPMGAAINLAGPTEIRRALANQGDPRADEDVPAGSRSNSVRGLMARRQERIRDEAMRLARDFPVLLSR